MYCIVTRRELAVELLTLRDLIHLVGLVPVKITRKPPISRRPRERADVGPVIGFRRNPHSVFHQQFPLGRLHGTNTLNKSQH